MDSHAFTETLLSVSAAAAAGRLFYLGLRKRFPALLAYLSLLATLNFLFAILDRRAQLYFWAYLAAQPLDCIFGIFAVREMFALVFDNYRGIRTVGRWAMYASVAISVSVSLLVTRFFWSGSALGRSHSHLFYWEASQRSIVFALAVVIVTILFVLSKYPLRLGRNTWISSAFFGALFVSEAARLLIDSLTPELYDIYVDSSESIFSAVCLLSWAALLRPEIASAPRRVVVASTPQEEHLLLQLELLNKVMSRAARK